ncbi:MAG TPA: hypothetical protein VKH82_16835, partial [Candidatus Binatia bacterium]|nr:hypothetical protein [Candidatus Binatia bacterium]
RDACGRGTICLVFWVNARTANGANSRLSQEMGHRGWCLPDDEIAQWNGRVMRSSFNETNASICTMV